MCIASIKSYQSQARFFDKPPTQIDLMLAGFRADKALGVVLTALFAVYIGSSRLDVASHIQSRPLTSSIFLLWAIRKAIQLGNEYWLSVVECVHQVDDVLMRVSSSQTMTRIKSSVSASSMRFVELATGRDILGWGEEFDSRSPKISSQNPFLSLEATSAMTLSDLKNLFRFATNINRLDFNKKSFLFKLNDSCRAGVDAIDQIVLDSRGPKISISTSPIRENSCALAGDMDALVFIAVVRIFAEWRSLRLVPDGHQRYAIGMGLAKRDLIQNVQKIETAVYKWMADHECSRFAAVELANGRQVSRRAVVWVIPLSLSYAVSF